MAKKPVSYRFEEETIKRLEECRPEGKSTTVHVEELLLKCLDGGDNSAELEAAQAKAEAAMQQAAAEVEAAKAAQIAAEAALEAERKAGEAALEAAQAAADAALEAEREASKAKIDALHGEIDAKNEHISTLKAQIENQLEQIRHYQDQAQANAVLLQNQQALIGQHIQTIDALANRGFFARLFNKKPELPQGDTQ